MVDDNGIGGPALKSVPVDWEALEDAFENNAPEVHSYLHLQTGEVLRIVDGVADPQMHARIAADSTYLRIDPVSSREQYRWMERYIPMVDDVELRAKLAVSIDGKGAFRRFKDVLMSYGAERERWFAFRSERLRIFMEAWLNAHALRAVPRPIVVQEAAPPSPEEASDESAALPEMTETPEMLEAPSPPGIPGVRPAGAVEGREVRKTRTSDNLRRQLRDIADALGPRDLETLTAFGEFLKARRAARVLAQAAEESAAAMESAPTPLALAPVLAVEGESRP